MIHSVRIGQYVKFVDEQRVEHDALVTMVWGSPTWNDDLPLKTEDKNWPACVNLVYVIQDETRTDSYGRQTRHVTSVVHESLQQAAGGYLWRHDY